MSAQQRTPAFRVRNATCEQHTSSAEFRVARCCLLRRRVALARDARVVLARELRRELRRVALRRRALRRRRVARVALRRVELRHVRCFRVVSVSRVSR